MSIASIRQFGTRALARGVHLVKHYAPEILTGAGILGGITSTVLIAKQTLKLEETINQGEIRVAAVRQEVEAGNATDRDLFLANAKGVLDVVKLYAGPVALGGMSVVCILGGHGIMRKRTASAVAALGVMEQAFAQYRERVAEEFGEEKEREIRAGVRYVEVEDEKGKLVKKPIIDERGISIYARVFNRQNSTAFDEDYDYNIVFLRAQERYANQKLKADGFLILNDLYENLGFKKTPEGALVGWIAGEGDDEVSFDMDDMENIRRGAYLDGEEGSIFLDFNVQGVIWDRIGKIPRPRI